MGCRHAHWEYANPGGPTPHAYPTAKNLRCAVAHLPPHPHDRLRERCSLSTDPETLSVFQIISCREAIFALIGVIPSWCSSQLPFASTLQPVFRHCVQAADCGSTRHCQGHCPCSTKVRRLSREVLIGCAVLCSTALRRRPGNAGSATSTTLGCARPTLSAILSVATSCTG